MLQLFELNFTLFIHFMLRIYQNKFLKKISLNATISSKSEEIIILPHVIFFHYRFHLWAFLLNPVFFTRIIYVLIFIFKKLNNNVFRTNVFKWAAHFAHKYKFSFYFEI